MAAVPAPARSAARSQAGRAPQPGSSLAPAPARPAAPKRAPAGPRRAPAPQRAPVKRARTAPATARGAAILDTLLAGRGWIALVFVLLAGIVFFNVDLLRMNRDIAQTAERAGSIKRENARLRGEAARLGSSERIQAVAAEAGLVMPAPGAVRYLRSRTGDAPHAARALAAGETPAALPTDMAALGAEPVIDPATGLPVEPAAVPAVDPTVDPATGLAIDPATGAPADSATTAVDPATGLPTE